MAGKGGYVSKSDLYSWLVNSALFNPRPLSDQEVPLPMRVELKNLHQVQNLIQKEEEGDGRAGSCTKFQKFTSAAGVVITLEDASMVPPLHLALMPLCLALLALLAMLALVRLAPAHPH